MIFLVNSNYNTVFERFILEEMELEMGYGFV